MHWNQWKHRAAFLAALAGLYWAFIFLLTHVPGSGGDSIPGLDKVAHFLAYFGLTVLLGAVAVLWRGFSIPLLASVWLLAAAYGVFDELSQQLVPGRTCSLYDWLADALGGLTGILIIVAGRRFALRSEPAPVHTPGEAKRR